MNLANFEYIHLFPPFWGVLRHAVLRPALPEKYLKAPELNWKLVLHWRRFQKKKKQSRFGHHKLNHRNSTVYIRSSKPVRISFVDSTRRNNRYQPSFGLMYHTNEVTYVLILSQQNGKQPDDAQLLEQTVDQSIICFADMFLFQVVHLSPYFYIWLFPR